MNNFTHFDDNGNAIMVDVSEKNITTRIAKAVGTIVVSDEIMDKIKNHEMKKGDVLTVAQVAGIMGIKNTSSLIPMCHPLPILKCSIEFNLNDNEIEVISTVKTEGKTGVEMEALTGVNVALLTIYDMCKAVDKRMVIKDIHLLEKSGGKSGDFKF